MNSWGQDSQIDAARVVNLPALLSHSSEGFVGDQADQTIMVTFYAYKWLLIIITNYLH